jgi:hypothetical protein
VGGWGGRLTHRYPDVRRRPRPLGLVGVYTGLALLLLAVVVAAGVVWTYRVRLGPGYGWASCRGAEPRRRRLALLGGGFVIMSSSLVWIWWAHPVGWGAFPGSNAYVWLSLVVLAALTQDSRLPAPVPAHGIPAEADRS